MVWCNVICSIYDALTPCIVHNIIDSEKETEILYDVI